MMQSGQSIGRYRIVKPLGRGGMGEVYLADDTRLQRQVALKFLTAASLTEEQKQRFTQEARAAAMIQHPNVCPIYDIEEADGQLFIAMAYLEGETLAARLGRGPLAVGEAARIAAQVASGLEKAHALGVVHRDIKSGNIMLSPGGHVAILDFGLALLPGAERLTLDGNTVGTPAYMSPEQAQGLMVDQRTDLWSLGVILYEMLSAEMPFARPHPAAIVDAILNSTPARLRSLRPEVPEGLERVVDKALAKKVALRWQTAQEMREALQAFAIGVEVSGGARTEFATTVIAETRRSVAPPVESPKRWWIAAVAVVLVVLGGGGWFIFRGRGVAANERLVAVLPFEVLGGDAETAGVANGMMEEVSGAMAEFGAAKQRLSVVPSIEIRRRNITTAEEAKRVHGAQWVVTGTAQKVGGKIQFHLQLIETENVRQVGARVLLYDPADAARSSARAVEEVARLLSVERSGVSSAAATGGHKAESYGSYLKARGLLARYDVAGNVAAAIPLLEQAVQGDERFGLAHALLGEAYWRKGRPAGDKEMVQRGTAHAERALQLEPRLPAVRTTLGMIYATTGREEEAIAQLKEALRLAPGHAEAHRELANVYVGLGRFAEAEQAYLQATRSRPTDWYGFASLGLFYYQSLQRYDEAEKAFRKAQQLTPQNEVIYRNLGVIYLMQGRYDKAVEELQTSLKVKSFAATYNTLASAYFRGRKYAEAVAAMETAIDLEAERYYFWGNLGAYAKWSPGNEGKSRPALEKALEMGLKFAAVSPNDFNVRANLAEYYARLGDRKAAEEQVGMIPEASRGGYLNRLALVYELTGEREKAIALVTAGLKNPATVHQIKDDPDLRGLWLDPRLQQVVAKGTSRY